MKTMTIALASVISLASVPALAQSKSAEEMADEAANAAAEAAEEAAEGYEIEEYYADGRARPKTSLYNAITLADYPIEAWNADMEGQVRYRLDIDARGMVTTCSIIESSGHQLLDEETCRLIRSRAEFDPAQDENGNPVASNYEASMNWRKRDPAWGTTFSLKVSFVINERGEQQDCKIIERTGELPAEFERSIEREPCPNGPGIDRAPFRDENGVPVEKRVVISVGAEVFDSAE